MQMWQTLLLASVGLLLTAAVPGRAIGDEQPIREVRKDGKVVAIEGLGLSAEQLKALAKAGADDGGLSRVLSLRVAGAAGQPPLPAMAGKHEVVSQALRFTPRFALRPGLKYMAEYFPPPSSELVSPARYELTIDVPAKPAGQPTTVLVYPSAQVLPENQLRFYLQFSAPMRRGDVYQYLRLLQENGEPVDLPFLEIGEELWDTTGTRLTLLIDPGRIKRGLKPREENGPVLEAGRRYTLVVDAAWRDAAGQPLKESHQKKFAVGPPIERAIDPKEWKITPPPAGTDRAVTVRFPQPLDQALLQHSIRVLDANDKEIAGTVTLGEHEQVWALRPDRPWTSGDYSLIIDTTLEDLAGNRIGRAFEVDVTGQIEKRVVAETVKRPFRIP